MSAGPRFTTLYQFRAGGGETLLHTCRIDTDPDSLNFLCRGLRNTDPPLAAATQRQHVWFIPIHSAVRSRSPRARTLTLRYTGAKPTGIEGSLVTIPVFLVSRFLTWQEGDVGEYKGAPVVIARKTDGVPAINGR